MPDHPNSGSQRKGAAARQAGELPCPTVVLGSEYLKRLERLSLRFAAGLERREGAGRAGLLGSGEEFVNSRPYRPGEDLRQLDWDLLARLDRPYIRVSRREAAESWSLWIDTSASMGVGPPGKLQMAAEVAGGIAAAGMQVGARIELVAGTRRFQARKLSDIGQLVEFLQNLCAEGSEGLATAVEESRPPSQVGRLFLIGDLLDLEHKQALHWRRPGRELFWIQILAPLELRPEGRGRSHLEGSTSQVGEWVEWVDPEGGERLSVRLDGSNLAAYESNLERQLETWQSMAARHGVSHGLFSSDSPFESAVRATLEP
ncbi:MAG: DUF58 domain-containing protein [Planctomycetota bacterium]|nr:DUF58 domain-containing protein [Planctomycetota bacterium]